MLVKTMKYLLILILVTFSSLRSQYIYNWYSVPSGTTADLNCINGGFCVGTGGVVLHTANNGANWETQNSGTSVNLSGVYSSSNITLAAGNNGVILRSDNYGANWIQITSGTSNNLYSITRASTSVYFAAGASGTILTSTNAGINWSSQQSAPHDLKSISTIAFYGWACGSMGTLVKTSNWGVNWTIVSLGTSVNLNCIFFPDINTGWIAGNGGLILKSSNGGINWSMQQSGTASDLKSIYFIGQLTGWACGNNGTILNTTNGGENWNITNITGEDFNTISFSYQEAGITAGNNGKIFVRRISDTLFYNSVFFSPNNTSTWLHGRGIFDQDLRIANTPGFQWPVGSGKFAIFTAGLSIGAKVNGSLRMAMASYKGEYYPGYVADSSGYKVGRTDDRFRFYKVSRGDNMNNNPSWLNWGIMVPFGAPFVDVNHSGYYEPAIDTPGVRGASQTIFICLTDGFSGTHTIGEGFGGGTAPLYAEVHMTAWGYDSPGYQDMQFIKWDVINKSTSSWDSTRISIISDPDLGFSDDDYIGCDTIRNLGYCYNGDNDDNGGQYSYGINPPAVGFKLLNCLVNPALTLKSFCYFTCISCQTPVCETDPNGEPYNAYNFMRGVKKDGTPWVIPNTNPPQVTKFCFSGDPESNTGWTETGGCIWNCGGSLTGEFHTRPPGDRRMIINMVDGNLVVHPGDTQKVQITQLIARGTSNVNSVTKLKQLSDVAQKLCDSGFVIGISSISSNIPGNFKLYQNYPNPFNPVTNIKYEIAYRTNVKIIIYDINGREVKTLVNEIQNPGIYDADWDGSKYSSGVYFYKIETEKFSESRKMVLLK